MPLVTPLSTSAYRCSCEVDYNYIFKVFQCSCLMVLVFMSRDTQCATHTPVNQPVSVNIELGGLGKGAEWLYYYCIKEPPKAGNVYI
jgi:hypothetical protein